MVAKCLNLKDGDPVESRPGEYNRYNYIPLRCWCCYFTMELPIRDYGWYNCCCNGNWKYSIIKPASTTPVIAYKFIEVLEEAGMPAGVVNFIPGSGAEIGDYLVEHPRTRFISFHGFS